MSNIHAFRHFPGRPTGRAYVPPPDRLPPLPDDLDAARAIYGWIGLSLIAWGIVGLLWWAL